MYPYVFIGYKRNDSRTWWDVFMVLLPTRDGQSRFIVHYIYIYVKSIYVFFFLFHRSVRQVSIRNQETEFEQVLP